MLFYKKKSTCINFKYTYEPIVSKHTVPSLSHLLLSALLFEIQAERTFFSGRIFLSLIQNSGLDFFISLFLKLF